MATPLPAPLRWFADQGCTLCAGPSPVETTPAFRLDRPPHPHRACPAPCPARRQSGHSLRGTAPVIPACSPALLASVWEVLTADTFVWYNQSHAQPSPPEYPGISTTLHPAPQPRTKIDITAIRAALYDQFPSTLAVFQHFGRAGKMQPLGSNDIRLLGNSGLIVGNPRTLADWRWYCFRDRVGGDVVDAVGYCVMGKAWNRQTPQRWQYLQKYCRV